MQNNIVDDQNDGFLYRGES